jgi:hypothetical protein
MVRPLSIPIGLCLVVAATRPALAASVFTETWSDDGDLEGWYSSLGNLTLSHDDALDTLDWASPPHVH